MFRPLLTLPYLRTASVALPLANRVRIIGGSWRGRIVRFPPAPDLRPTPDRVRETLFNWLGQDLGGRRCLDLYAGTGALALEALSRGAAQAVAVDANRKLADAIAENGRTLGASGLEIAHDDARRWLTRGQSEFDVIFLDPPFRDDPWEWLLPLAAKRLARDGFLYAEAPRALVPPPPMVPWRESRAGQVHYHLFRQATRELA